MKKLISLTIIFAALTLFTFAGTEGPKGNKSNAPTTSISGTIVDASTGETLAGVTVHLEGVEEAVYTDFDGNFRFNSITPGEYTIKTNLISYKEFSTKVNVQLEEENSVDLKLRSLAK